MIFRIIIVLSILTNQVLAQECEVKGKVVDFQNKPIPGVNVVLKGTPKGTVTSYDGLFKISIPQGQSALIFAFVGFKTLDQEIFTKKDYDYLMEVTLVSKKGYRKKLFSSSKIISNLIK